MYGLNAIIVVVHVGERVDSVAQVAHSAVFLFPIHTSVSKMSWFSPSVSLGKSDLAWFSHIPEQPQLLLAMKECRCSEMFSENHSANPFKDHFLLRQLSSISTFLISVSHVD